MNIEKINQAFIDQKLHVGRMVGGSKSDYRARHPKNIVVFNANVVVDGVKVWYGDLDLTRDEETLKEIARQLNKELYILREMDARFDKENNPDVNAAVAIIKL